MPGLLLRGQGWRAPSLRGLLIGLSFRVLELLKPLLPFTIFSGPQNSFAIKQVVVLTELKECWLAVCQLRLQQLEAHECRLTFRSCCHVMLLLGSKALTWASTDHLGSPFTHRPAKDGRRFDGFWAQGKQHGHGARSLDCKFYGQTDQTVRDSVRPPGPSRTQLLPGLKMYCSSEVVASTLRVFATSMLFSAHAGSCKL